MADEVLVSYYKSFDPNIQAPPIPDSTVVKDIGESFQIPTGVKLVQIESREAAFWFKFGASDVSAAAETDGNEFLKSGGIKAIRVAGGEYIDTVADA